MASAQRQGEGVRAIGHGHQMDVIRHQAVAQQTDTIAATVLGQRFQIEPPVFVNQEDILTVVAPLADVVRHPGRHHPSRAWHSLPPLSHGLANPSPAPEGVKKYWDSQLRFC